MIGAALRATLAAIPAAAAAAQPSRSRIRSYGTPSRGGSEAGAASVAGACGRVASRGMDRRGEAAPARWGAGTMRVAGFRLTSPVETGLDRSWIDRAGAAWVACVSARRPRADAAAGGRATTDRDVTRMDDAGALALRASFAAFRTAGRGAAAEAESKAEVARSEAAVGSGVGAASAAGAAGCAAGSAAGAGSGAAATAATGAGAGADSGSGAEAAGRAGSSPAGST